MTPVDAIAAARHRTPSLGSPMSLASLASLGSLGSLGSLASLGTASIGLARGAVRRPAFDPRDLRPGLLHLGCGAFHRAHQALLTQRAIEAETAASAPARSLRLPPWGIVGVSLRSAETVEALRRQGGLYSVIERGPGAVRMEIVGSLRQTVFAPTEPRRLLAHFADPAIRVVTLTVTEGGYCVDPATGRLDAGHPDILADLAAELPCSAIGWLVHGLALRRAANVAPPVVLSCDNVPRNGRLLRQACIDHAALHDDRLSAWIAETVQFPSSMVDRIVPATTALDRAQAAAELGLVDEEPVVAEPFCQWVIERFDGPRPAWEAAGAQWVGDVAPWEASKLRLLNGPHLAIACIGTLAGDETVAGALERADVVPYLRRLMLGEQRPTLPASEHDITAYVEQLLERWRNPGIAHRLERVGRDASGKLAARLLAPLRENLLAGRAAPCTVLAVAAWMLCASGRAAGGRQPPWSDHRAARLRRLAFEAGPAPQRLVDAFLGMGDVFGDMRSACATLGSQLAQAVALLQRSGVRGALAATLAGAAP